VSPAVEPPETEDEGWVFTIHVQSKMDGLVIDAIPIDANNKATVRVHSTEIQKMSILLMTVGVWTGNRRTTDE